MRIRFIWRRLGLAACAGLVASSIAAGPTNAGAAKFVENLGQWDSHARFLSQTGGLNLWLTQEGPVFEFREVGSSGVMGHVVKMSFTNAQPTKLTGGGALPGRLNYLFGADQTHWITGARIFSEAVAEQPYNGVSVHYTFDQGRPRYDVVVEPGADPSQVGMRIEGADDVQVLSNGDLNLGTSLGAVQERGLTAYQEGASGRTQVPCRMILSGNVAHFDLGSYDPAKELVIDPLVYSTYLGGAYGPDIPAKIVADASQNLYIVGSTQSSDFPTTVGALQTQDPDAPETWKGFIVKMNPTGTALIYGTYFGGKGNEQPSSLAVDQYGDAFVTGRTRSEDFPITRGAFQTNSNATLVGGYAGFLTKLNPSGSGLVYSTFLSGSANDECVSVALDSGGEAFVAGATSSRDFPVTKGAYRTSFPPQSAPGVIGSTPFVAKFNAAGSGLVYSTLLGGSSPGFPSALKVDSSGDAFVAGTTYASDFPVTVGAFQIVNKAATNIELTEEPGTNGFVTKLNPAGTALLYSTYIGGSGLFQGPPSSSGGGSSSGGSSGGGSSTGGSSTGGSSTGGSSTGGSSTGGSSTGGTGNIPSYAAYDLGDWVSDMALDQFGNATIVGIAYSKNLPVTKGAFMTTNPEAGWDTSVFGHAGYSGFVAKLNAKGNDLFYSTYIGGGGAPTGGDAPLSVALDAADEPVLVGNTNSDNFPVTTGALQTVHANPYSTGFVTKLDSVGEKLVYSTFLGGSGGQAAAGVEECNSVFLTPNGDAVVAGTTNSRDFPTTDGALDATFSNGFVSTLSLLAGGSGMTGFFVEPNPMVAGDTATGSITLGSSAAVDTHIKITAAGPVKASSSLTIAKGTNAGLFAVEAEGVQTPVRVAVSASTGGASKTVTLTVLPLTLNLTLTHAVAIGGANSDGVVKLPAAAGYLGDSVNLSHSGGGVSVQSAVRIASGTSVASFPIATQPVSVETVILLKATYNGATASATLTLLPRITSFKISPESMKGGATADAVVVLAAPAGASRETVTISCDSPDVVVQSAVGVAAGKTEASFPIKTKAVTATRTVLIAVSFGGSTVSQKINITP